MKKLFVIGLLACVFVYYAPVEPVAKAADVTVVNAHQNHHRHHRHRHRRHRHRRRMVIIINHNELKHWSSCV